MAGSYSVSSELRALGREEKKKEMLIGGLKGQVQISHSWYGQGAAASLGLATPIPDALLFSQNTFRSHQFPVRPSPG